MRGYPIQLVTPTHIIAVVVAMDFSIPKLVECNEASVFYFPVKILFTCMNMIGENHRSSASE